jgi:hypothetical protein
VLSDVIYESDVPYGVPLQDNKPLADALKSTGDLLRSFGEDDPGSQEEKLEAAKTAVEACIASTAGRQPDQGMVPASESVLLSLHRILRAVRTAG